MKLDSGNHAIGVMRRIGGILNSSTNKADSIA